MFSIQNRVSRRRGRTLRVSSLMSPCHIIDRNPSLFFNADGKQHSKSVKFIGKLMAFRASMRELYYNPLKFLSDLSHELEVKHRLKAASFIGGLLFCTQSLLVMADDATGSAGIGRATQIINGYKDSVKNLCYAIAGCIVFVGAFRVGQKMWAGDQDVQKTIMLTIGGAVAMVALSEALPLFF